MPIQQSHYMVSLIPHNAVRGKHTVNLRYHSHLVCLKAVILGFNWEGVAVHIQVTTFSNT